MPWKCLKCGGFNVDEVIEGHAELLRRWVKEDGDERITRPMDDELQDFDYETSEPLCCRDCDNTTNFAVCGEDGKVQKEE